MFPSNLTMGGKNARKFTGIRKYSTANKIRITMSGIQSKITMYTKKKKKHGSTTHIEAKNQSWLRFDTDEELVDKDIKIVIITLFNMVKI